MHQAAICAPPRTLGITNNPFAQILITVNLTHALATRVAATYSTVPRPPFLVGICGWADTGKSTLASSLCASLDRMGVGAAWLSTDAFLKSRSERNALGHTGYNSLSIDGTAMRDAVVSILNRQDFTYHPYENRTGCSAVDATTLSPQLVIVIEGIHAFHPAISKALHLRVFIDADESTLRAMRVRANVSKRGMSATDSHARVDKEMEDYRAFTLPLKSQADLVVEVNTEFEYSVPPGGGDASQETPDS